MGMMHDHGGRGKGMKHGCGMMEGKGHGTRKEPAKKDADPSGGHQH
jgi:hypothetical protein